MIWGLWELQSLNPIWVHFRFISIEFSRYFFENMHFKLIWRGFVLINHLSFWFIFPLTVMPKKIPPMCNKFPLTFEILKSVPKLNWQTEESRNTRENKKNPRPPTTTGGDERCSKIFPQGPYYTLIIGHKKNGPTTAAVNNVSLVQKILQQQNRVSFSWPKEETKIFKKKRVRMNEQQRPNIDWVSLYWELQTLLEEYQVLFLDSSFSSSGDALDKTGKNSRGMERTNKHGGVVHNN